jgi:hypothetical protein
MSEETKNICVINNIYYINIVDDISDLQKNVCSSFQPFRENYSKKTLSNINTKTQENKIIITENNDEITYFDNIESNRIDKNDDYKENNNINFSEVNDKEVLYIEIPKMPKKLLAKKRFFNVCVEQKKGRKGKSSNGKSTHTKYSHDNILRKIKVKFFIKLIKYINKKIKSKYKGIIGLIKPLRSKISQDNTIHFNKELLKAKLKEIFSNNEINGKFTKCEKNYNKMVIDIIYQQNIKELIDIFELTFLEAFDIFRGTNETEFSDFEGLNIVLEELKEKGNNIDYIKKFYNVAMNFENYYLNKISRK